MMFCSLFFRLSYQKYIIIVLRYCCVTLAEEVVLNREGTCIKDISHISMRSQ